MDELIKIFYSHQIVIKSLHFQTKKYGYHKACDEYLSKFSDLFDKFMETSQGYYGKMDLTEIKLSITLYNDNNIDSYIEKFIKYVNEIYSKTKVTCLQNILDEIAENAGQFRYLLTFH